MRAAAGFSVHTGWAVVVLLDERATVLERLRLELADPDHDSRFVYHAAAEDPGDALQRISRAGQGARQRALKALSALRFDLAALPPAKRALPELSVILAAHPLLHRAEGELYRSAIVAACEKLGVAVVTPAPVVPGVGKMKPPWGKDQKDAAALAWAALQLSVPRAAPR